MYINVLNMSLFREAQFICTIVSLYTSYRCWYYWLKSLMKPYKYIYDIWRFLLFIEHTSWCKSNQVSVLPNKTIHFILMIIDYGIHLSSFSLLPQFECTILFLGIWILLSILSIIYGMCNCTSCTWTNHVFCGLSKIWLLKSFISDPLQHWLNYTWIGI